MAEPHNSGAPADEIKITPQMTMAGALKYVACDPSCESLEEILAKVFKAMWEARIAASARD